MEPQWRPRSINGNKIEFIDSYFHLYRPRIGPHSHQRNDACECTLYLTQLGGFVLRRRPVYIVLDTIYSPFNPLISKGILAEGREKILEKNPEENPENIFRKKNPPS